jgi:DNA-binding SARP family transcriptional activator
MAGSLPPRNAGGGVELRILGPLELEVDGRVIHLGPKQAALLALLALEHGHPVSVSRLCRLLWPDAPENPKQLEKQRETLRSHVQHLRRTLEPGRPARAPSRLLPTERIGEEAGYALRIRPDQLDSVRFTKLFVDGRRALDAGDPRAASSRLHAALTLWRGPVLIDLPDPLLAYREVRKLEDLHQAALLARIEADLALGRHVEVVTELEELVARRPGHEDAHRLLALAHYRSHRFLEAAAVCREGLELLAAEGLDSPVLQRLQQRILNRDPALEPAPVGLPARPGGIWNVPFHASRIFTGRDDVLELLRRRFADAGVGRQVIAGLGGVGKTQVAVEYVLRHRSDHPLVWWVRADQPATLAADFTALAAEAPLAEALKLDPEAPQEQVVDEVRAWLERMPGWLLVFDDAPDADAVAGLLPEDGAGHVLVTSRRTSGWNDLAELVPLDPLLPDEAAAFLVLRSGDDDPPAARRLAGILGCLPLALEQAGAYVAETTIITLARYAELFGERSLELLGRGRVRNHPQTVDTTWDITLNGLRQDTPGAVELLQLAAFAAPDDWPLDLLAAHADRLSGPLGEVAGDPLALADAVGALQRYALAKVIGSGQFVHGLLQTVVREKLDRPARQAAAGDMIRLLRAAFPEQAAEVANWAACARLLPHALAATAHAERLGAEPERTARLLDRVATYLQGLGRFAEARVEFERALALGEVTFGPDSLIAAELRSDLGNVLHDLGELAAARSHLERARRVLERTLPPDHPDLAANCSTLGVVLRDIGDLPAAREAFEEALRTSVAAFGSDHPDIARDHGNLGLVLHDLGALAEARTQFERALAIDLKVRGLGHLDEAIDRHNLGKLLASMGEHEAALDQLERSVAIATDHLGSDHHPWTTTFRTTLDRYRRQAGSEDRGVP